MKKNSRILRVNAEYYEKLKREYEEFCKRTGLKITLVEYTRLKARQPKGSKIEGIKLWDW